MKGPYHNFERNILVNKLNDIGADFQLETTLLRGESQYSCELNCKMFSIVHEFIKSTKKC